MNRHIQRLIKNQVKDRLPTSMNDDGLEEWIEEQLANWPSFEPNSNDLIFFYDYETFQIVAVTGHFSFFNWRIKL